MKENCQAPVFLRKRRRRKRNFFLEQDQCIPCLMCLVAQYSRPAPAVCGAGKLAHLAQGLCARDGHSSLQGLW